jgi:hypothetical protein
MPPPDFFHQLRDLDQSISEFPDRLVNLFDEQGYRDHIATLQHDGSIRLIEYLDTVSPHVATSLANVTTDIFLGTQYYPPCKSSVQQMLAGTQSNMWLLEDSTAVVYVHGPSPGDFHQMAYRLKRSL